MCKKLTIADVYKIETVKSTSAIKKPLKSQNTASQSKFNKIYHDELKKVGICRNL